MFTILVIESDQDSLDMVRAALEQPGIQVHGATDAQVGLQTFLAIRPQLVLVGTPSPDIGGTTLLETIVNVDPGVDVIAIAAHYSADSAVEAIQKGASDYIAKPLDLDFLRRQVLILVTEAQIRARTLQLDLELLDACQFEGMVGRSPLMLEMFARIRRVAPHFLTIVVTGASGTGKELVAQALHRLSPARQGKFVVCNCSALVEDLAESELFGHVRGSFTGANQDKIGLFEHADGGSIFLDEIGELSPSVQAKLLRVLQNRQVQRVGSLISRSINVRVIAATHRNLKAMVRDGTFREDLYYRLAVVEIKQPALIDRREDLPLLERHFLQKFAIEYKKPISGLTRRAQARLASYRWPGNVRELENAIGHGCMMADGTLVDIGDLPERFKTGILEDGSAEDRLLPLDELQRRHLLRVLESVGGNKARAAQILGIGRATIYEMLARMNLQQRTPALVEGVAWNG